MAGLWRAVAMLAALCSPVGLHAEPLPQMEADRAQSQMLTAAMAAGDAYAREVALDQSWASYCWTETNRKAEHAADGSIPFGVNYRNIERGTLTATMQIKGAWLRNETILCLARAKADLARASDASKR